mmetsp:Transcript_73454/g.129637  ORF Transcript_73454/g.129637 Transcript_73454/m.129637 type:complete len:460 (+) Transcript_73454:49-1428(+)
MADSQEVSPASPSQLPERTSLEHEMKSIASGKLPTEEEKEQVEEVLKDLLQILKTSLENPLSWRVSAFGSSVNGCGTRGCDVDVVAYEDLPTGVSASDSKTILRKLKTVLSSPNSMFSVREAVLNARIPILKLQYQKRDVDLSINNTNPLPNTRLLKAYTELDSHVAQLGILVKLWSKSWGLCGAANGYLSSYAFQMMVIYFLQVASTKLPSLQQNSAGDHAFENDEEVNSIVSALLQEQQRSQGLAELLLGFFQFYSQDFRWGTEVVSVRLGRRENSSSDNFKEMRLRKERRLHIEDPFDRPRNLCDVIWGGTEAHLWEGLAAAHGSLQRGKLKDILPTDDSKPWQSRRWGVTGPVAAPALRRWGRASEAGQGHKLPRSRLTQSPVAGKVVEWRGKYGWIISDKEIRHESSLRNGGRIFVSMSDVRGKSSLSVGECCSFHVFADESGLGAEECISSSS